MARREVVLGAEAASVQRLPAAVRWSIGIVAAVVLTALSAHVSLPIPGTPVPFTFQPLAVMLCGALLGSRMGAAGQLAYLLAGVAGAPVFAAGAGLAYLLGPTGGYLMAYPAAAWVAGLAARGGWPRRLGALLAALATIYAGGLAWLATVGTFTFAVALGLKPFILADLVKVGLALLIDTQAGGPVRRLLAPAEAEPRSTRDS